jgi:hypothetical protein
MTTPRGVETRTDATPTSHLRNTEDTESNALLRNRFNRLVDVGKRGDGAAMRKAALILDDCTQKLHYWRMHGQAPRIADPVRQRHVDAVFNSVVEECQKFPTSEFDNTWEYLLMAADRGDRYAALHLGNYGPKDRIHAPREELDHWAQSATKHLEALIEKNDGEAMTALAYLYFSGTFGAPDFENSLRLYERSLLYLTSEGDRRFAARMAALSRKKLEESRVPPS